MNAKRAANNTWGQTRREASDSVATPYPSPEPPTMRDTQYRQALALFRYGLIAEFINCPQEPAGCMRAAAGVRPRLND